MTTTVSACLITRNGADTLPRLLDSVRPHVDEVCILDTGSTDGTLDLLDEFARAPGAPIRVGHERWRDDYAWARNASFDMSTSDYCVWFDDDEILKGGSDLRQLLAQLAPDVAYIRRVDNHGTVCYWGPRAVRSEVGEWRGAIHEDLCVPTTCSAVIVPPPLVHVLHEPITVAGRHDFGAIEESELERQPSRKMLAIVAHARIRAGDPRGALQLLQRALDPAEPLPLPEETGPLRNTAPVAWLERVGSCLAGLGDNRAAITAFVRAELAMRQVYAQDPLWAECHRLDLAHQLVCDVRKPRPGRECWGGRQERAAQAAAVRVQAVSLR